MSLISSLVKLLKQPGAVPIVLINLYPFYSIGFLDWSVYNVMLFFWIENVMIGLILLLKILHKIKTARNTEKKQEFATGLFTVLVYAIFTHFHGLFVNVIFGVDNGISFKFGLGMLQDIFNSELLWPLIWLAIYYLIGFIKETRENKIGDNLLEIIQSPFVRVALLQITLIFGGGIVMILGEPMLALILLMILKIILDLILINTKKFSIHNRRN